MKWLYNPPGIIKKLFSQYIWESKVDKVLLTFDDGPLPGNTEAILKTLNEYSLKSLFFCVGNNIEKNPDLAKEIIAEGHSIGNHTFNHRKLNKLNRTEMINEIELCSRIIEEQLSYKIKYFRPPHGKIKLNLAGELEKLNLTNVMWSLLTYDYKGELTVVKKSAENYLQKNSIIVLHDNVKSKNIIQDSIKIIAETVYKNNFEFGTPAECLK